MQQLERKTPLEWWGEDTGCVDIPGENTGAEIRRLLVTWGGVAMVITAEVWVTWARANVQVAWAPVGVDNPLNNLSGPSSSFSQGRVSKSPSSEGVCVLSVPSKTFSLALLSSSSHNSSNSSSFYSWSTFANFSSLSCLLISSTTQWFRSYLTNRS